MSNRKVTVFDFDNTLIKGDSLRPFLMYVAGPGLTGFALIEAFTLLGIQRLKNKNDPALADWRTFVKTQLLRRLLGNRKVSELGPAIEKLRKWCQWNQPVRQALNDRFAEGHQIVIASGALNIYLPELLKDFPPHALICTTLKQKGGVLTGELSSDNCVRQAKAQMLADYLSQHDPFDDSWGYGNAPNDLPMLNMLNHRIVVS